MVALGHSDNDKDPRKGNRDHGKDWGSLLKQIISSVRPHKQTNLQSSIDLETRSARLIWLLCRRQNQFDAGYRVSGLSELTVETPEALRAFAQTKPIRMAG